MCYNRHSFIQREKKVSSPIYLDYAATTPVDQRVADKMLCYLTIKGDFANPASNHLYGKTAKNAVEIARQQVAALIQAEPTEIIWTSGATESNNLALKGAAHLYQRKGKHIITLKTEHKSVLDCCQELEKQGFSVTYLSPEANGLLNLDVLRHAFRADTILVSIMHVNNETGVIQDIQSIADITSGLGILFHVDAAQSAGKIPLNVKEMPIDLISFSAHKVYGPKGIGALYLRKKPRVRVEAQIHGGGQESGMRSGTLPTHQIVGMGEAFHLAQSSMQDDLKKIQALRARFLANLSSIPFFMNGDLEQTYPGILNVRFPGKKAESLLQLLPELIISTSSACFAKGIEPSYVLRAMGLTESEAHSAVRFSFGRMTTMQEIDLAARRVVTSLRALADLNH